jgi:DNA-binding XRE family transcriptional regulator
MPLKGQRTPLKQRFDTKYSISKETGCWNWTGAVAENRYGVLWVSDGRSDYAHRISYVLHKGPIPPGKQICHHCDNMRCVRPDHLYAGTPKQNADDKYLRGRVPDQKGELNPRAKLTAPKVKEIRSLLCAGILSQEAVGKMFGVSRGTVKNIKNGRSWGHIE